MCFSICDLSYWIYICEYSKFYIKRQAIKADSTNEMDKRFGIRTGQNLKKLYSTY